MLCKIRGLHYRLYSLYKRSLSTAAEVTTNIPTTATSSLSSNDGSHTHPVYEHALKFLSENDAFHRECLHKIERTALGMKEKYYVYIFMTRLTKFVRHVDVDAKT